MRLIDADALKQAVNERYHDPWIDMLIRNATTVDAVPVVRCKDCKYWCPPSGRNDNPFGIYEHGAHCGRFLEVVTKGFRYGEPSVDKTLMWCGENDFCSYGERK